MDSKNLYPKWRDAQTQRVFDRAPLPGEEEHGHFSAEPRAPE